MHGCWLSSCQMTTHLIKVGKIMHKFKEEFVRFKSNGCFALEETTISCQQLNELQEWLLLNKQDFYQKNIFFQLKLKHVKLILSHPEELTEQEKEQKNRFLTGNITEEEYPPVLKGREQNAPLLWTPGEQEMVYKYRFMFEKDKLVSKSHKKISKKDVRSSFLNVLAAGVWEVIQLDHIVIIDENSDTPLDFELLPKIYTALLTSAAQLKELSLQHVELYANLVNLLQAAQKLEILRLEKIDQSDDIVNWLCESLVKHPTLRVLALGKTRLNEASYSALTTFLNNNYRLEKLDIAAPPMQSSVNLHKQHEALTARMVKSSVKRFKDEQLTLENLYTIARIALETSNTSLFKLVLNKDASKLKIVYTTDAQQARPFLQNLSGAFSHYPEHITRCFPIALDLQKSLENQATVGANLLERAFELQDANIIQLLLNAGVNLLEETPIYKSSLAERIFSKKELSPSCKEILIEHVKKDLSVFAPFLFRLAAFNEIDHGLKDIKLLLDHFLSRLLEQQQLLFFLGFIKKIGAEDKQKNWEKNLRLVIKAAQTGSKRNPVDYASLSGLEKLIKLMLHEAQKTQQQYFSDSQFNKKLVSLLDQLLQVIEDYKNDVYEKWEKECQRESAKKTEKIDVLQRQINQMKEEQEVMSVKVNILAGHLFFAQRTFSSTRMNQENLGFEKIIQNTELKKNLILYSKLTQ
jgi:hypothetical protein